MKNLKKILLVLAIGIFACKKQEISVQEKKSNNIEHTTTDISNEYFITDKESVEYKTIVNSDLAQAVFYLSKENKYPKFSPNYITWDTTKYLSFDSLFSEGNLKLIIEESNVENINALRIFESTFFDYTKNKLEKKIIAAAPLRSVYSDKGEYLGYLPLFYVKFE